MNHGTSSFLFQFIQGPLQAVYPHFQVLHGCGKADAEVLLTGGAKLRAAADHDPFAEEVFHHLLAGQRVFKPGEEVKSPIAGRYGDSPDFL